MKKNFQPTAANDTQATSPTSATMSSDIPLRFVVGDRVFVNGISQVGTVKFLGTTHFADGIWVGIELSTAEIGKSDGSVQGHRYFVCPPQHGIFIPPAYCTKFIASSPTVDAKVDVDKSQSVHSTAGGGSGTGFRALWPASNLLAPPPIRGHSRTKSADDLSTLCSGSPLLLPPPRKVTVEYQQPNTNSSSPAVHSSSRHNNSGNNSSTKSDDLATNAMIDKIVESPAFAKRVQQQVDRAVEKSLQAFASDVSERYASLESLLEVIGAAVAEVCDKVDDVVVEQAGSANSSSSSGSSNERKEPSSHPTSPPSVKSPSSSSKLTFGEVDLMASSLHGVGVGEEDPDGSDPYLEVARLRKALTTVSLLAREAQEEIACERDEMEEQIRQLRAQLQSQQAT
jgi:hypothetical protein